MNKCEHGQRINYFCATDCCVWKEASGCEVCIRKYHNHMGTTVFLNEEDISSILKKFTIESQSKPKCRMLQEAIYSYFTAIKAEISSSIDIVCKNLIYQIGYPYLNAVNSLPTYRRLKNKQYRKLGQKDFKNFYELSQKISDKELVSQQSKIYLKQLKGAAQLISTLEDAFKQYETGVKRYHSNFVHDVQPAYRIKQLLMSLNINESSNMNGREFKKIDNLFGFTKERQEDKTNNYKAQQKKPFQLHKNGMTVLSSADRPNYSRDVSIDRKIIKQPLFVGQVQTVGKQSSQKEISPPKLGGFLQRQKSQRIQHTRPQMNKRELQISQKKKMLMEMMKQKQERDTIPAPEKTFNESIVIGKQRFAESPKVSEEKQVNSSYQWNQTAKKQMNHLKPPTNFPRKISINQNLNTMTNSVKIPQNRKLAAQKLALSLDISQAIGKRQPQKSVQKGEKKVQSEQMNINVQETKSIGFQNQNISDKSQKGSEEQSEQEEQKANLDINYAFTQLPVQQKAPKRMGLADRVGKKLIVIPTIGLQKDQQDEIKSPLLKKKNKMDRYKESLKIKQPIPQTTTMQQEAISEKQVKQNFKQPECFVPSHRRTETQLQLKQNEQISLALLLKSLALKAEEAIVYLQKALVHAENNLSAAEYLSFLYLQLDRPLDCLKLCNKTLQKIENSNEPDDLSLMLNNNKAAALNILGRYSESIVLLQKCLRHREKDLFYKNLGDAYSSISIYEKAIYSYEKALKLNDQLDEAHYNLAVCLFGQLNYNNAKLAIQKAIDLNPTNMQYHELLKNIVTRIYHY